MIRSILTCAAAAAAWLTAAGSASAQIIAYTATLNGAQEAPTPVVTPATGVGTFVLNAARDQLSFNISYQGLGSSFTAAHFHNGAAGVAGGVVRGMTIGTDGPGGSPNGSFTGVWRSTDAQPLTTALVNELLAGRIYFNIHTATFGGGEIRGQLSPVPEPGTWALTGVAFAVAAVVRRRRAATS